MERNMQLISLKQRKAKAASLILGLTAPLALSFAIPLAAAQDLATPDSVGMSASRLALLDSNLQRYVDEAKLAGQVYVLMRRGEVVAHEANGMQDIEDGVPMSTDTLFRIASQTKAITSLGIMMLQERGLLDINAPLSRYLPEWKEMQVAVANNSGGYTLEPARREITLRHLLTHTGGMSYGNGVAASAWAQASIQGWYFADREEPVRDTIARMASLPLDAHPGEQWIYGYNTDILGAVIEQVSGQDLASFFATEIFAPLGMNDTHFYLPANKRGRLATVYRPADGGVEAIPETNGMQSQGLYDEGPRQSFSGGAGLLSTASDYAKFLQMTLNGGELNGTRLVSRKTIELMTTDHLGDIAFQPGQGFGLGFSIATDLGLRGTLGSEGEYAWGGAYHSVYWVDPVEDLLVVYLTQIIPATNLDDHTTLRNGVYQAIVD
jgi:CubicO group peptidase (beta-lactamase class C family)